MIKFYNTRQQKYVNTCCCQKLKYFEVKLRETKVNILADFLCFSFKTGINHECLGEFLQIVLNRKVILYLSGEWDYKGFIYRYVWKSLLLLVSTVHNTHLFLSNRDVKLIMKRFR